MSNSKNRALINNEHGFASIVIGIILIIIMGLLTVGFAQLSRREQQTALSKQLADQAYYAAESGINAAAKDIQTGNFSLANGIKYGGTVWSSTVCNTPLGTSYGTGSLPASSFSYRNIINASNGASFTCLLVDLTPKTLSFGNTPPGSGQYLNFSTTGSSPLASITIQWGSSDNQNNLGLNSSTYGGYTFPSMTTWNAASYEPLLQFSLTTLDDPSNPGKISRSALINDTFNTYLYPASDNSPPVPFDPTNEGQIIPGDCHTTPTNVDYPCSVTINNLNSSGQNYILHYVNIYDSSKIIVSGTNQDGTPATFVGQATIDVTGKAHNVLKRLQAALSACPVDAVVPCTDGTIGNQPLLPNNGIQAQNICKRLDTRPGITNFKNANSGNADSPAIDPCNLNL